MLARLARTEPVWIGYLVPPLAQMSINVSYRGPAPQVCYCPYRGSRPGARALMNDPVMLDHLAACTSTD